MSETVTKPFEKRTPRPDIDPREAGRVGGVRSGEARRAKRDAEPRHWGDVLLEELQSDPQRVVRAVFRSRNAAAITAMMQLARDVENQKLRRLADVDRRTDELDDLACRLMDDVEAEQRRKTDLQAENAALAQERRELEALRDEMRAEIAAAGYGVVDDDEPDEPGVVADAAAPS